MSVATSVTGFVQRLRPRRWRANPIDFTALGGKPFGPLLSGSPSAQLLLQECIGIANVARRALANRVATLEPEVRIRRRVTAGTVKDEILDDHVLKLLLDRPHPNISRRMLLRLTTEWLVTVGEAHYLKIGSLLGVPRELLPIPPGRVTPFVAQGVIGSYEILSGSGGVFTLPASEVVRIYLPDPGNLWRGAGYLAPVGSTADALKFAGQHLAAHYQHNATPKSVIETSKEAGRTPTRGERDRFDEDWRERYHQRLGQSVGVPGLLPLGYHLIQLAAQSGADVVPLLEHWRDTMLMNFGTPRALLGQVVAGDRSSAEATQWMFDLHAVTPLADAIADALTLQLAPDFDSKIFVVFADFAANDKEFEMRQEETDLRTKVKSINQVREDRGLDPVEWGDLPVGSIADVPYDGIDTFDLEADDPSALEDPEPEDDEEPDDEPPPDGEDPDTDTAEGDVPRSSGRATGGGHFAPRSEWKRQIRREKKYVPVFTRALRGIVAAQRATTLERLLKLPEAEQAVTPKRGARVNVDQIFTPDEWRSIYRIRIEPLREAAVREIGSDVLTGLGLEPSLFNFDNRVRDLLRRQGALLVSRAGETTKRRLARTLSEGSANGESIDALATRVRGIFDRRRSEARTIARTEVLKASQTAQVEGFRSSGVVEKKQWNTSMDDAVRDSHGGISGGNVDGQVVPLDSPFILDDGETADAPGIGAEGGELSAGNAINCRCFVTPVIEGE